MSLTLFGLGCIVAARSALVPLRKSLRAPDGILVRDVEQRGRALNAIREIDHELQRLALLIDPSCGVAVDGASVRGPAGDLQVHEGNVVLDVNGEKSA